MKTAPACTAIFPFTNSGINTQIWGKLGKENPLMQKFPETTPKAISESS